MRGLSNRRFGGVAVHPVAQRPDPRTMTADEARAELAHNEERLAKCLEREEALTAQLQARGTPVARTGSADSIALRLRIEALRAALPILDAGDDAGAATDADHAHCVAEHLGGC